MANEILHAPFRADVVGSFLRPKEIKQVREDYTWGRITPGQLREIEDRAIADLVAKEKAAGLTAVTDGEFRRQAWHLDFMWAFEGVGHATTKTGLPFKGEQAMIDDTFLTGKVSLEHEHPFVEHFRYVNSLAGPGHVAKQTIPAPAQFLAQMAMPFAADNTKKYYKDFDILAEDIAGGYKKVIASLYAAGCRNLQFDDCTWTMLLDESAKFIYNTDDKGLDEIKERYLAINNAALEGKPADMVINTHVCRGNYHSTYASEGPYDKVAPFLFARENVDAFYLEFDDARSGGFEPLKFIPEGKKVVLGLITTKSPVLENESTVIKRIEEASKIIPLENLCLSPQCGFASCEIGNRLTEEEQWAKVRLVSSVAKTVWG